MAIVEITSREFREKQRTYFELADKGEKVIIKRGRKQSYILTPIKGTDLQLSPETEKRIEKSREQYRSGKAVVFTTAADAIKHLESL